MYAAVVLINWCLVVQGFIILPLRQPDQVVQLRRLEKLFKLTGEELQIRILEFEILYYFSRRSDYFGNFPVGWGKIVLLLTFWLKFPKFLGKW